MTDWEVRTDPADPNAHDVWAGAQEAHLIAASPDLLEACRAQQEMERRWGARESDAGEYMDEQKRVDGLIRAAILRAEGR